MVLQIVFGSRKPNVNNDTEEKHVSDMLELSDGKAHCICELSDCQDGDSVICPPLPRPSSAPYPPGEVTL